MKDLLEGLAMAFLFITILLWFIMLCYLMG